MHDLHNNKFVEFVRAKINAGDFKSKEDLIKYMQNLSKTIDGNTALIDLLKQEGINLNSEDMNKIVTQLLDYYDKTKVNTSSLNLDGVSQFKVEDKDYIKVKNEDGSYTVLDDSMNDDTFVKQFEDRQNASFNYQSNDGVKNRKEIVADMKEDKVEATLTSSVDVNIRELTPKERRQFGAIMRMNDIDKINILFDPERNIYINRDTGETFYAYKNQEGKIEVRKANEQTVTTVKEDVDYVDQDGKERTTEVERPVDEGFENLDDFELKYIVDNKLDALTPEQKAAVLRLIEKRKQQAENQNSIQKENEKEFQKVKTYNFLNKPYNGFASVMVLSLITALYGVIFITYLLVKIYS